MNDHSTSRPGHHQRRRRCVASVGLLAIVGVLAAGCGGSASGGGTSASERASEAREAALEYARCMREHGVDLPDPTFEEGGIQQAGPPKGVPRAKLEKADKACEKYKSAFEPPELSEEEQAELKKAALAHARCMREHGVEKFPDPTFGENGEARIRVGPGTGVDPEAPKFKEAQKACRDTQPKPPSEEAP